MKHENPTGAFEQRYHNPRQGEGHNGGEKLKRFIRGKRTTDERP